METLIETLSQFSPRDIEELCRLAKIEQVKNLGRKVPPEVLAEFRKANNKCDAGQTFRVEFKLPIKLDISIKAEHEFGHLSDWKLNIFPMEGSTPQERQLITWFTTEFFDSLKHLLTENPWALERLTPEITAACEQETQHYKELRGLSHKIINKYGVDPHYLIK